MVRWFSAFNSYIFRCGFKILYRHQQNYGLVNVKLKWVKDSVLDGVVAGGRDVKAALLLVSIIASNPCGSLPVYHLSSRRGQLGLPHDLKISTFMRRFPSIFDEFHVADSGGTSVPWFRLTADAINLHQEECTVLCENEKDLLNRLCKLLMLTKDRTLPLQTIDQLKWDMGLPFDYVQSLIIPRNQEELFSLVRLPDDRIGLKLVSWDDHLAVSQLENCASLNHREEDIKAGRLGFPVGFTRGFGLKRTCMEWLEEWQRLPYTSPYSDASHLDSRTDVSEKRIVGVFHELLHLTIQKKTERQNFSNLRKPLALPYKFTKVFERHPGIFYISKKNDTQTVVLREAYDRHQLIEKHPLCDIRERFACLMKKGFLDRSRGLHKKTTGARMDERELQDICENGFFESEGEPECTMFPDYESDEATHHSF